MNRSDILVPLNLEKHSLEGLKFASRLSVELPRRITLLYVVELNVFPCERRVYDELCKEHRERLRVLAQCFFAKQPRLCVRVGKAYQEILGEANDAGTDMIVMGIPESPRWKWLGGIDTVKRVVRDAPCLTLVLSNSRKISPDRHHPESSPSAFAPGQSELLYR